MPVISPSDMRKEWLFLVGVAMVLLVVSLWPRLSGDLTQADVIAVVEDRLAAAVDLRELEIAVFSIIESRSDARLVAARLVGEVFELGFERAQEGWRWIDIRAEGADAVSVADFVHRLRSDNENGALDALRLINTAEVAHRIRNGRYAMLGELLEAGFLMFDLQEIPPRGFAIELEATESTYRVYATPTAYPRSGVRSFYSDDTFVLRGGDRQGERAGPDDQPFAEQ